MRDWTAKLRTLRVLSVHVKGIEVATKFGKGENLLLSYDGPELAVFYHLLRTEFEITYNCNCHGIRREFESILIAQSDSELLLD